MKINNEIKEKKTSVQQLRIIRNNIGLEIQDMKFEELKKYIEERITNNAKVI